MKKSPLSIRIIFWFTNIVFWIILFTTAAIFFANLILLTDIIDEEFGLSVQMPVPIEVVEKGAVALQSGELTVRVEEAYGKLYIIEAPMFITKIYARILFVVMMLGLFMIWRFKQFITNIKNGIVFEPENINNLKQIAYGLLALWLASRVYFEVFYHTMVKHMEFESIIVGRGSYDLNYILQSALGLWALAHIFMKGLEMKKEQDLTI